jgi:peptidoglycan/xylan/chitin deacetylase (PgdA/CDA1 family)
VRRDLALCYHALSSTWSHPLAVRPDGFHRQLTSLAARGYRGVTLSELAVGPTAERRVAITFDDGFASVARHAASVLDELGWPATVFCVVAGAETGRVGWLDLAGAPPHELEALRWDELRALAARGWEIGSHGCTHRLLSTLADAELAAELRESRAAVEANVGVSCRSVSYPWGELDDRVVVAARAAGYAAGSGLAGRFARGDAMRVPRVAVSRSDGDAVFAVKTSGPFSSLRATSAWTALELVRR